MPPRPVICMFRHIKKHTSFHLRRVASLFPSYFIVSSPFLTATNFHNSYLINIAPTPVPTATSIIQSPWSKEAIFALLGILVVILIPCLGFLLKLCIAYYTKPKSRVERSTPGMMSNYENTTRLWDTWLITYTLSD